MKYGNVNLYCAIVWNRYISCLIIGSTWKILVDNGDNKYTFFLEWIRDNVVYVKPCFVPHVGSNAKQASVKPYAWCMVRVPTSCISNWIFVITWERLLPIYISFLFFQ